MESKFCAFLAVVSLVGGGGSAVDDTLSCFLRARSHYVLGDPEKGKYYAFTFEPPTPVDRDILDPCFISCIMSSRCSAILFYRQSAKSPDDGDDVDISGSCKLVLTDEAMRLEVMYGDVADLYIKRSDANCDRDGGEPPRTSSSKMTPMVIAGDPRLYSNPMIRHLLGSSKLVSETNGHYEKPRLQLNALNFLWGHQVFANIYHTGNNRNGKYTDRQGWGHREEGSERNGNPGLVSTTLPSPTTRRPLTRSVVKAGHMTNRQGDVRNRNLYSNRVRDLYSDNEGYAVYEPKNNDIEEPMEGNMFGAETRAVGIDSDPGVRNTETPEADAGGTDEGDHGGVTGRADVGSSDADADAIKTTPHVPTESDPPLDRGGDENSRRPRTFFKEDVLRLIFGDPRREGFAAGRSRDSTSADASTTTATAAATSGSSEATTTTATTTTASAIAPSAVGVAAADRAAADKADAQVEEITASSNTAFSDGTASTTSATMDTSSLAATESTMAATRSSTTDDATTSPTTTTTTTTTAGLSSAPDGGSAAVTPAGDAMAVVAAVRAPAMRNDGDRGPRPLSFVLSRSIGGPTDQDLAVPTQSSGSKNDSQTTPETIAFSATLSSTLSVGLSQNSRVIVFDDLLVNEGGAYNASSGVFTAPVDGVYVFTVDIQSMRGTLASVKIMRNDDVIHSIRANGRNTGDQGTGSGTISIFLSRGDDVYAKLFYDTGYTYVRKSGSRFTGFKLP